MPREPHQIQFESRAMPADDGLRLNKDQCLLPPRPKPPQHHPEQFVRSGKPRLRMPLFQNGEMLAQDEVFKKQVPVGAHNANQESEEKSQRSGHELVVADRPLCMI
jgi:hypothetical protein